MDENSAGQRLDNFLIRLLKGVPKTHVYRIIRSGEVRVNKGRAAADTRVAVGDLVRVPPVRLSERMAGKAEAMAFLHNSANPLTRLAWLRKWAATSQYSMPTTSKCQRRPSFWTI